MKNHFSKTGSKRSQCGAAALETAFVMVLMLLIMAGVVEFGRTFWYYNALSKATRGSARLMSEVSATDMADAAKRAAAVAAAKSLAVSIANGARVSPAITDANVLITCDGGTCGAANPANVAASISGFSVTLGSWFPFVTSSNGNLGVVDLAPSTTMRYMH